MTWPAPAAVFFDMDGTIVDSEPFTDRLVAEIIDEHRLRPPPFPLSQFHGVTWDSIATTLVLHYPELAHTGLVERLQSGFHRLFLDEPPQLIPGVQQAFMHASEAGRAGVVSSSERQTIEAIVDRLELRAACSVIVGAEDVQRSKPDPQCYRLAAQRADADPAHCFVFEDSIAGLQAARAAGMRTIGVLGNLDPGSAAHLNACADLVIVNFEDLPPDFFAGADDTA